jgi:hypothetical protein
VNFLIKQESVVMVKEKSYFKSAPFFLLKGLESDESPRFGLFSHRTLLKPSLQKKETFKESLNDVVSLHETHTLHKNVAEILEEALSVLLRLTLVFKRKFTSIDQEETLLTHLFTHYPKRELDLRKIIEVLPSLSDDQIPDHLLISFALGALTQKGVDQGEFFIELKKTDLACDILFSSEFDETKKEMIRQFCFKNNENTLDPSLFFKNKLFKARFVPRLKYHRVIISPARWVFDASLLDLKDIEDSLQKALETYEVDEVCFIEDEKEMKLISCREEIPYLVDLFKKSSTLIFTERLFTEKTVLIKGEKRFYPSEIILPLFKEEALLEKEEIARLHA